MTKINVNGTEVSLLHKKDNNYISLTDIAKYRNSTEPFSIINNWMRNRSTIEFIGLWEVFNNPNFKPLEFDRFKNESGHNYFVLSPQKWIETTNAIGIISKSGRYGGTFGHIDIAFEFASWLSSEFKFYLIKEFQRLKNDESKREKSDWNLQRTISKINYRIHTDAIRNNIIPRVITKQQSSLIYANEADLLNVALFGMTAKEWRDRDGEKDGNIRDYASLIQLVVLSNLESINALLISQNLTQAERLFQLNNVAITQIKSLVEHNEIDCINNKIHR